MKNIILIIVILLSFCMPRIINAADTWVCWMHEVKLFGAGNQRLSDNSWSILGTDADKITCEKKIELFYAKCATDKSLMCEQIHNSGKTQYESDGAWKIINVNFICLPDTVNPRGTD